MKKISFCLTNFIFLLISLSGCTSTKQSVKRPYQNYMVPKEKEYSYINFSDDLKTASFNEKEYVYLAGDEFDNKEINTKLWNIYNGFGDQRAKAHDGSWFGSKIYGNKEPFDEIISVPMDDSTHGMGKEIVYTEDGILHLLQCREKKDDDWYLCHPSIQMTEILERGTIIEIRYKMPVRGSDAVYHMYLGLMNDDGFNEQGWTFKQLFLEELLSGRKNEVNYGASMWFGQKVESKEWSVMDNAIADSERERDALTDYDTPYNVYDDNAYPYKMTDEQFYEWHTATAIYDEERFAVYHDGLKVYDWVWDETPQIGKPQDAYGMKGPALFGFGQGLAGDWAEFFNFADRTGCFDESVSEYDLQIDYIRAYKLKELAEAEQAMLPVEEVDDRINWFKKGTESGVYDLYCGNLQKDLSLQNFFGINYSENFKDNTPISFTNLDNYQEFGFIFDEIKDLSDFRKQDYCVEMDIKTLEKNINLTVGFYDSKEKSEFAWKYEYVITGNKVPADGQWHKVRIPFSAFKAGGIWDNDTQTFFGPEESKFTWKNVNKFAINNGPDPLSNLTEIDNIRIVK